MIEVEQLSKLYGTSPAIQDVSFTVKKGEILGFLGPNGAGKTTTMRILTGYLPATSGTARVAGFDVHDDSMAVRQRIGYLPETPPLYPEMTVEGFLHFVARIKGVAAGDRAERVEMAMTRCNLLEKRRILIRKLSKGFRQRVGIAQAIVHDPPVIILDEPTVGLDPRQIIDVRNLIKSLAGDHTIILSTHILPEVKMTCDRITIINRGQVVATNTPSELVGQLQGSTHYELDVAGPVDEVIPQLEQLEFVESVQLRIEPTALNASETKPLSTDEPEWENETDQDAEDVLAEISVQESEAEDKSAAKDESTAEDKSEPEDKSDFEEESMAADESATGDDGTAEDESATGDDGIAEDESATGDDGIAEDESATGDDGIAEDESVTGDEGDRADATLDTPTDDATDSSLADDSEAEDSPDTDMPEETSQELEAQNGRLNLIVHFHPGAEGGPELAKTVINAGLDLYEMRRSQASLEDVFLNLTTADPSLKSPATAQPESSPLDPPDESHPKPTVTASSPPTEDDKDLPPQEEH